MSEKYIRQHFADIKGYASAVENRAEDEGCTMERVLADNAAVLESVKKHQLTYVLIDDEYAINVEL